MTISRARPEGPNAVRVQVSDDTLVEKLSDARSISAPLAWYPRLLSGSPEERRNLRLIGGGQGIRWEKLDEDISVESLLAGRHSGESQTSLKRWWEERAHR